ncbi:DUF998 domain-containing protein [Streptomyces sp. 4.24]|uniref:DUF998 domain-containing protein n=1 Tax=Streptomyces tritrimontium TaxID=3406573 RepID=UPI003BB71C98
MNSQPRPNGPSPAGVRSVAALIGLGAAAYTAWVLEVVLSTGLNPIETYVSELAAQDQPLGGLFRATDFTAGLLVFLGGALALARLSRIPDSRRPWSVAGWAGVTLFGASTAADAWLPLSCAPTADPECAARETAGLVPATLPAALGPWARRAAVRASRAGGADPAARELVRRCYRTGRVWRGALLENSRYPDAAAEVLALRAEHPLTAPVTVLAGHDPGARRPGLDWLARQAELADRLGARFTVAEPAGHLVMLDRPHQVARAVLDAAGPGARRDLRGKP